MTQAYPLQWPAGWPRARQRVTARFQQRKSDGWMGQVTIAVARERLQRELDLLGASYPTLSTNVELRLDGQPRSDRRDPVDTGAAVYFRLQGKDIALACDKWDRVADNITAIAKHIEAMRGMDRWGLGTAAQAFAGYERLAAPEHWTEILGLTKWATRAGINQAYRSLAQAAHPDRGGSDAAMARLNAARDAALREVTE
nr:J domain-containing protein [Sphingobium sp.]